MNYVALAIALLTSAGCSFLGSKEDPKASFDFGSLGAEVSQPHSSDSPAARVVIADIKAPAWIDSPSMYYRLAYRNAAQPIPYARSQWVMSPADLLTQRLRSTVEASIAGDVHRAAAGTPEFLTLRSELVDFEQVFDEPDRSRGVLRLRATLSGDGVWAQRTFTIEKPAPKADAAGGVTALIQCADELAAQLDAWVSANRRQR
ncbi:ABC-type transport auxiliary lipoprotein family protein [Steroidobacter cummioxidans]|uniref:ABC-type transport auxiliary lipoprotein family protein n=1 Tax=Steroidobacter cummioxidans TaxID=1803913 RepID=UPI000E313C74|nr:ABC-type transport auxiliary lipoprotein family protein [Steroidobacter cummioxidans]